ncbi:MAG: DUF1353 domain-containing protein [Gemmatimonas sp.]|nr:DUF1353 domain-containing protein [Gemmatimonas sp.]
MTNARWWRHVELSIDDLVQTAVIREAKPVGVSQSVRGRESHAVHALTYKPTREGQQDCIGAAPGNHRLRAVEMHVALHLRPASPKFAGRRLWTSRRRIGTALYRVAPSEACGAASLERSFVVSSRPGNGLGDHHSPRQPNPDPLDPGRSGGNHPPLDAPMTIRGITVDGEDVAVPTTVPLRESRLARPHIDYIVERELWIVLEEYRYQDRGHTLVIPIGFTFNLASVPRIIWPLVSSFELGLVGPLIHDFLYRVGGRPSPDACIPLRTYSRGEADVLFKEIMKIERVPGWRWRLAYQAVRWLGGSHWRRPLETIPTATT